VTDLHLISWNRPKMTELVIKTIHKNTPRNDFRLVVLDNASEPETVEMLQGFADNGLIDEFLPIKTNLGLEAARDLLLREATETKRFVCVDNDCLPPLGWLDTLNILMDNSPDYAAISLRTDPMIGTGNIFEHSEEGELVDFPHPGGSYRLMNTAITRRLGGWDRHAPGRGSEERYICSKLHEAGYKTAFVNIKCLHLYGEPEKTDRWGYPREYRPEDTGHSDVWHPKFAQGDDPEEVKQYAGEKLTNEYFNHDNSDN